ncbi:hypothetical protein Sjap_009484 [Stephania japonica]|uniref:Uncharacterized protein n=1 Tax=Stephania japonica TaxID=461633 RepID=A0AAP0JSF7_9MAGN
MHISSRLEPPLILLKTSKEKKDPDRMARPSCSSGNGSSSSPVPLIGLYIAGATAVCFLLMLCDIISSVRHKTRYIPCKWFSLNSATLTLLAIASKLPVDLTTYMPSASDQLSKLTGTTLVCVSICFLIPSLAINGETESISNMIALSLFVVTIAVNICIQISTGVIFLFIVEHIIILCCMMMLLIMLWPYAVFLNMGKTLINETMRNAFQKRNAPSLLHQVKLWYMSSCISNPQYLIRGGDYGRSVLMICFLCLTVLSQAALRLLIHKFEICEGISDYGRSISIILVTQIITVVVMSLSTAFRFIVMVSDPPLPSDNAELGVIDMYFEVELFSFLSLAKNRELRKVTMLLSFYLLLKWVVFVVTGLIYSALGGPLLGVRFIYRKVMSIFHAYCPASSTSSSTAVVLEKWKIEMKEVFSSIEHFPKWIMRTCVEDMKKWTELSNTSSANNLVQLLSRPHANPPQALLNKLQQIGVTKGYYKLSCLSIVILVKTIALSIPFALAEPIMRALDEAFGIVYYVDEKVNVGNFQDGMKRRFAKVLLALKNVHLSKNDSSTAHLDMSLNEVLSSITNEMEAFPDGLAKREMEIIRDFVHSRKYASIEELHKDLEQLFVDMLLFFLPQLPIVIFKDMNESPIEVFEERARYVLKLLCKLKLLEDKVQWVFPEGCHVTRLMDPEDEEGNDQARNTEDQNLIPLDQDGIGASTSRVSSNV